MRRDTIQKKIMMHLSMQKKKLASHTCLLVLYRFKYISNETTILIYVFFFFLTLYIEIYFSYCKTISMLQIVVKL